MMPLDQLGLGWSDACGRPKGACSMHITVGHLSPIVSILAGVLILLVPRLLNYIVAIYLIVIGILGLGLFR